MPDIVDIFFNSIPPGALWGSVCILIIYSIATFFIKRGWGDSRKYLSVGILLEYMFLIMLATVICRKPSNVYDFNFIPFWSYYALYNGTYLPLELEIPLNIILFIPIGFFGGLCLRKPKWQIPFILSLLFSVSIEVLQFVLKRGLSETDDVIHNTLGCMVGYWIVSFLYKRRLIQ